ncbi:unnamed protein product [Mytilus edulis]|uniref:Uncharacterized protein n=1 Tax=Mytilus edulis TaxID=6550 RepID=A0A8S3R0Y9_MYTED|nr:unnamed protein product [Mytilus edulis]
MHHQHNSILSYTTNTTKTNYTLLTQLPSHHTPPTQLNLDFTTNTTKTNYTLPTQLQSHHTLPTQLRPIIHHNTTTISSYTTNTTKINYTLPTQLPSHYTPLTQLPSHYTPYALSIIHDHLLPSHHTSPTQLRPTPYHQDKFTTNYSSYTTNTILPPIIHHQHN